MSPPTLPRRFHRFCFLTLIALHSWGDFISKKRGKLCVHSGQGTQELGHSARPTHRSMPPPSHMETQPPAPQGWGGCRAGWEGAQGHHGVGISWAVVFKHGCPHVPLDRNVGALP